MKALYLKLEGASEFFVCSLQCMLLLNRMFACVTSEHGSSIHVIAVHDLVEWVAQFQSQRYRPIWLCAPRVPFHSHVGSGILCDLSHGLGQFRQDAWIRQHGQARHRTTALVGLKELVKGGTELQIIMSVSNPRDDLRTEEPMSGLKRRKSIALGQDGIAHGREARLGPWRGTGCVSTRGRVRGETRALLKMARSRHRGGSGKEIEGHGRPVIPAIVDSSGGFHRGGIPGLAQRGFPRMGWAKSISFRTWTA